MDPYLEEEPHWPEFQHHLVLCLYQILLPGLVDRYRARVSQRHYVTEQALFTTVIREEHQEDYIEIRQRGDGKLVTLLDVVSPSNRTSGGGRQAYLETRKQARNACANIVEIDLVLQGEPMLDYSRENLPEWDFAVTVTRAAQPERHEIYTSTLLKRLPRFRLPLAADDRDTVLDLHTAFNRSYDQVGFGTKVDYTRDPATRLSDTQRQWLGKVLKEHQLR
jgi:hypothetical protein